MVTVNGGSRDIRKDNDSMIRAPGPHTCLGRCPLEVSTWPTISSSTCSKQNWLSSFQMRFLPGSSSQQTASLYTKSSRSEAGHHARLFLLYHTKNKRRGMRLPGPKCLRFVLTEHHLSLPLTTAVSVVITPTVQIRKLRLRVTTELPKDTL